MRSLVLGTIALALVGPAAHADFFSTFNLSNVTLQDGSLTGTLIVDTSIGRPTSAQITLSTSTSTYVFSGAPTYYASTDHDSYLNLNDPTGTTLQLSVPALTFAGYKGSPLCSLSLPCIDSTGYHYYSTAILPSGLEDSVTSGALVIAPVPEPSTLILLGPALLGAVGFVRRRR